MAEDRIICRRQLSWLHFIAGIEVDVGAGRLNELGIDVAELLEVEVTLATVLVTKEEPVELIDCVAVGEEIGVALEVD